MLYSIGEKLMKVIEIPISSPTAHFVQENDIFGQSYILEFEWIEREAFWMLHITNSREQPVALGLSPIKDWPLHIFADSPFVLMFQPKTLGANLSRSTLSRDFCLVAYEAL
jgi:hypothetical protein